MNAVEARKKAKEAGVSATEWNEVQKAIKEAVREGEFECWYYKTMTDELRTKLRTAGYKVGVTQWDRNDMLTKISW